VADRLAGEVKLLSPWLTVGCNLKAFPPVAFSRTHAYSHQSQQNQERLADLGGDVLALSSADFGKFIADETEKWAKVIRAANIKAD